MLHSRTPPPAILTFHFIFSFSFLSRIHRNLATAQIVFLSHQIYVDYVVRFREKVALDEITLYASYSSFLRLHGPLKPFFFFFWGGGRGLFLALHLYRSLYSLPPHPLTRTILFPPQTQLLIIVSPPSALLPYTAVARTPPSPPLKQYIMARTIVRPRPSSTNIYKYTTPPYRFWVTRVWTSTSLPPLKY